MSYIGTNKVGKMYLGSTTIGKAYLGEDLVYDSAGGSPVLPYDAEIEYLQSSGTQYINTGIKPTTNFKCEIKAQYLQNNNGFDTMVGCFDGTNYGVAVGLQSTSGGNKLYIQFGGGSSFAASNVTTTTALHTFITQLSNNTLSINVDGMTNTSIYSGNLPNMNLFLFARNKSTVGNFANAKIYYCKIWNGGNLVFDAIPVRVGQTGYMYDKVSGQLFGNQGSGNFMLGHDKMPDNITPVEYLQATGTQYIDTGLSPTTNSHVIIECSNVLNASLENESFGYGVSGGQRFHMVAVANWNSNKFHAGCGTDFIYTTAADTANHTFELYGNGTFVQDGTSYSIGSSVGTISDTMPLFARLWNGSYQYSNGVRIHSFKWYESETLVLDLIPVRVGQVGYMYDKVSGELFGNSGSGSFTLGNDK